jgi:multidrug resistance protein, MATE family
MGMVYMTACAAAFVLFRHELIGLFVRTDVSAELAAEIVRIGGLLMICAAVFQTADAFGIVYTGALRGAGDTVWPGVVTIIYSWAFIVLGGWLFVVFWPGLESLGPWIAAAAYIILYGVTMALRFESGRWRSIQLLDREDEPRSAMEPVLPGPPPSSTVVRDLADDAVSVMESRR